MSYYAQAKLAIDSDFSARVTACAATLGEPSPESWAFQQKWRISGDPTLVRPYAEALEAGTDSPGRDQSVISDQMILDAVKTLPR